MKRESMFRTLMASLCCLSMLSGQVAQAAGPRVVQTSRIADVALNSAGTLHGQVLDAQGIPQANIKVALARNDQRATHVTTDAAGAFVVAGLTAGVYEIRTEHGSSVCRVWAPRTAPPSAQAGVLVVNNQHVVRGFGGRGGHILANPWVMGLVVAGAIAIPLALDSSDDSAS